MSKAIDSCLLCTKSFCIIVHTGEAEGHRALELHVYGSNPSSWISHGDVFNPWCAPNSPIGTYITSMHLKGR